MTALITSTKPATGNRRRTGITLSAMAGICYAAAWIISLSVGAPNPSVDATGRRVVAAFAGQSGPALIMFVLAEGVAAVALVAVVISVARAALRAGQARAGQVAAAFGIAVAVVSWAELALGTWLITGLVPGRRTATAGAVYHTIMRIDGAKMFLLAAMALAIFQLGRTRRIVPQWLAPSGVLLAGSPRDVRAGLLAACPRPCRSGDRVRNRAGDIRLRCRNIPGPQLRWHRARIGMSDPRPVGRY